MNKKKLVSTDEYKQALIVVNKYLSQMEDQYKFAIKDTLHLPTYTQDTKLLDCDLSVRLLNCLNANDFEIYSMTVGDLGKISQKKLLLSRNMGKKSLKELKNLAYRAGVLLKP